MLVLFLDVDGVLNSWQSAEYWGRKNLSQEELDRCMYSFCPIAMSNLNNLCEEFPDLKIVVSSTWRKSRSVAQLQDVLADNGFLYIDRVVDKTPVLGYDHCRGDEIKDWLSNHPLWVDTHEPKEFVIVDDDSDMGELIDHLIQTDARVGFDYLAFLRVSDYFTTKGFAPKQPKGVHPL